MKKEEKEESFEEKMEKLCFERFGYSPAFIDDLFDTLKECHQLIHYYLDTIHVSDEAREQIRVLSIQTDKLLLDFNELFILNAEMLNEVKKEYFLKQTAKISEEKLGHFHKKLLKTKDNTLLLVDKTREYVQGLQKTR
jgi:hypothetical protein